MHLKDHIANTIPSRSSRVNCETKVADIFYIGSVESIENVTFLFTSIRSKLQNIANHTVLPSEKSFTKHGDFFSFALF